jgi:acyl-CoA synthetase (AMP-forming)/AMP-acid ligase II
MTAQTIRDGWVVTGDIAYQDDDGYLYIADRKKDMIVSGGMNIYPAEVEAVIYRHPAVAQVAVIGVPDERWGEAVKAVIELKQGAKATEQEIIDFCKQHLASQKKPKSVDFVDALPVTNAGKVSKKEIRDQYWQGRERRV